MFHPSRQFPNSAFPTGCMFANNGRFFPNGSSYVPKIASFFDTSKIVSRRSSTAPIRSAARTSCGFNGTNCSSVFPAKKFPCTLIPFANRFFTDNCNE